MGGEGGRPMMDSLDTIYHNRCVVGTTALHEHPDLLWHKRTLWKDMSQDVMTVLRSRSGTQTTLGQGTKEVLLYNCLD